MRSLISEMCRTFEGVAKIKNLFSRTEEERGSRFHLLSVILTGGWALDVHLMVWGWGGGDCIVVLVFTALVYLFFCCLRSASYLFLGGGKGIKIDCVLPLGGLVVWGPVPLNSGLTYGDMAEDPATQQMWDDYINQVRVRPCACCMLSCDQCSHVHNHAHTVWCARWPVVCFIVHCALCEQHIRHQYAIKSMWRWCTLTTGIDPLPIV